MPVWIQNAGMAALSADQIVRLCTEIENVSWVKEEVAPSTHNISALMAKNCSAVEGVMGGGGGRPMMTEHARGSKGVIHACQVCDIVQKIWELLDNGNSDAAGELFERLLPALMLEGLMGMSSPRRSWCAEEFSKTKAQLSKDHGPTHHPNHVCRCNIHYRHSQQRLTMICKVPANARLLLLCFTPPAVLEKRGCTLWFEREKEAQHLLNCG